MTDTQPRGSDAPPQVAQLLGVAGLLPQVIALLAVISPNPEWRFTGLAMGYAYAAIILSFLGGIWWGLAAQTRSPAPTWVWVVAVVPSLVALASALPWAVGEPWPGPSLGLLGLSLLLSVSVDYKLQVQRLCPRWWLRLRVPLSAALGLLTLLLGFFA